jgi:hypothetical protein
MAMVVVNLEFVKYICSSVVDGKLAEMSNIGIDMDGKVSD